jgi:hypothetical protein
VKYKETENVLQVLEDVYASKTPDPECLASAIYAVARHKEALKRAQVNSYRNLANWREKNALNK